ncbi:hypothetical protein [Acrocarpospora sp. B8E8]|uniref:glycosyltransferase n=1 Tax=Acrocarpospora sp. B8E8 TaxID=3153572 RepID=UPI00325E19C0
MISEIRATLDEVLVERDLAVAVVACAGFDEPAQLVGGLRDSTVLVNLDGPVPELPAVADGVAVVVRTPADLFRIAGGTLTLPSSRRQVVHLVEAPAWWRPPLPFAAAGFATRALASLRIGRHGDSGWVVEAHFSAAVPAGWLLRSLTASPSAYREEPLVDLRSVNPIGFLAEPELGPVRLTVRDGAILDGATRVLALPRSGRLGESDIERLRPFHSVTVDWQDAEPLAAARLVAGLAAAGVPLHAPDVPAEQRALLGAALCELIGTVPRDPLEREEHSIRLRRTAMLAHAGITRLPSVSVLLATRRPDLVGFALAQIGDQRGVDVEIVVAGHGFDPAPLAGARVTTLECAGNVPLGAMLNLAAERASGEVLTKWDDDDWYSPDHLLDLSLAARYSGAELTGAPAELIYLEGPDVTVRHRWRTESRQDFVAGGTLFLPRTVFDAVGGFRPIPKTVDGELLRAVRQAGGQIYQAHGLGYVLRRGRPELHTWQENDDYFLDRAVSRWAGLRSASHASTWASSALDIAST